MLTSGGSQKVCRSCLNLCGLGEDFALGEILFPEFRRSEQGLPNDGDDEHSLRNAQHAYPPGQNHKLEDR
jgi:hypothetical protein